MVKTYRAFEGIHLAGEGLHLTTIVISLLLGQTQGLAIPGRSLSQVSKLLRSEGKERDSVGKRER